MAEEPIVIRINIPEGMKPGALTLNEDVTKAVDMAGMEVEAEAKSLAPRFTGNLQRSITSEVTTLGGKPTALVGTAQPYARSVEYGSKPHTPPRAPIFRYAQRKGLSEAQGWAMWWSIRKKGTKEHPFMRPAFSNKKVSVTNRIEQAIRTALGRFGQ